MNDNEQQIANLIQRIDSLTLEANGLTRELQELTRQRETTNNELEEGDTVVITNNYLGQRGTTGVVTNVTSKEVTLRNTETGRRYTRKKSNVRRTQQGR